MKQRFIKLLVALVCLLCGQSVWAQTTFLSSDGYYQFTVIDEEAKTASVILKERTKNPVELNFPAEGTDANGVTYRVTTIKSNNISGNANKVTTVVIPEGVTTIAASVFSGCTTLTSVTLPSTLTSIGNNAFQRCGFESITIPQGLATLGSDAFNGCANLTSISLPGNNLRSIQNNTFAGCSALTEVTLGDGIESFGDNVFSNCESLTSLKLPNTLQTVGSGCFGSVPLDELVIPGNVYYFRSALGSSTQPLNKVVFEEATPEALAQLTSLPFSSQLDRNHTVAGLPVGGGSDNYVKEVVLKRQVGNSSSFARFYSLEKLTVGGQMEIVRNQMFQNRTALTEVILEEGVKEIWDNAFEGCSSLTTVSLPDGLQYIGAAAFNNCPALKELVIPSSVTTLTGGSLGNVSGTTALDKLTFEYSATPWSTGNPIPVANLVLNRDYNGTSSAVFLSGGNPVNPQPLKTITLGDRITKVSYMFKQSTDLTDVTAPWMDPITIGSTDFAAEAKANATLWIPGGPKNKAVYAAKNWAFDHVDYTSFDVDIESTVGGTLRMGSLEAVAGGERVHDYYDRNANVAFSYTKEQDWDFTSITVSKSTEAGVWSSPEVVGVSGTSYTYNDLLSDLKVKANFTEKPKFDVDVTYRSQNGTTATAITSVLAGGGIFIDPENASAAKVYRDRDVSVSIAPGSNSIIVGVEVNGVDKTGDMKDGRMTFTNIQGEIHVVVIVEPATYNINLAATAGGNLTLNGTTATSAAAKNVTVNNGSNQTVSFVADTDYDFTRLEGKTSSTAAYATLMTMGQNGSTNRGGSYTLSNIKSEHYLKAVYTEKPKFQVQVSYRSQNGTTATANSSVLAGGGITIDGENPAKAMVYRDRDVTISTAPGSNSIIVGVEVNGVDKTGDLKDGRMTFTNIQGAISVVVIVEPATYNINLAATAGGNLTLNGTTATSAAAKNVTVNNGSNQTVSFVAGTDYDFTRLEGKTSATGEYITLMTAGENGSTNRGGSYTLSNIKSVQYLRAVYTEKPICTVRVSKVDIEVNGETSFISLANVVDSKDGGYCASDDATFTEYLHRDRNAWIGVGGVNYRVVSIMVDGVDMADQLDSDNQLMIENVQKDLDVVVTFMPKQYDIFVSNYDSYGKTYVNGSETPVPAAGIHTKYQSAEDRNLVLRFEPNEDCDFMGILSRDLESDETRYDVILSAGEQGTTKRGGTYTMTDTHRRLELFPYFHEKPKFNVSAVADGGTVTLNGSSAPQEVYRDRDVAVVITPDEGHYFSSIRVNGEDMTSEVKDGRLTLSNIQEDQEIYVNFEIFQYSITKKASTHGTISLNDPIVLWGTNTRAYLEPEEGYMVDHVYINGVLADDKLSGSGESKTLNINNVREDIEISAEFSILQYKINISGSAFSGAVVPSADRVDYGQSVVLTFGQDSDYRLTGLTVNGTPVSLSAIVSNKYTISNITEDVNVAVTYESTVERIKITNATGATTFCCDQDLDFTGSKLKAYIAVGCRTELDGTFAVLLSRIYDVPAGTGLYIVGTPQTEYKIPYSNSRSHYINMLIGNCTGSSLPLYPVVNEKRNYYFGTNGSFNYFTTNRTVSNKKAYLQIPLSFYDPTASSCKIEIVFEEDLVDGINDFIMFDQRSTNDRIYNLNGQQVDSRHKGVVIKNGKKVLVK